jgi:hypothetical protein
VRISGKADLKVIKNSDRILVKCPIDSPSEYTISNRKGRKIRIVTIPHEMAMGTYPVMIKGKEHLVISDALVLQKENEVELYCYQDSTIKLYVYPSLNENVRPLFGRVKPLPGLKPFISAFEIHLSGFQQEPRCREVQFNKFALQLPQEIPAHVNDLFLVIDYMGDTGMGFINGDLVADHFYNGHEWIIGLKRFAEIDGGQEMVLYFRPLYENAIFLNDLRSSAIIGDQETLKGFRLNSIRILPEYKEIISF